MAGLNQLLGEFSRFAGVGAIGTACHYFVFITLVEVGMMDPLWASTAGFLVGALVNYTFNYYFTFRSNARHSVASLRFFGVALVGMLLNGAIMDFLHRGQHLHYLLAQVLATGLVLLWNYLGSRLWAFRETR